MIYLVRHGQTDFNLVKKYNGSIDNELNQTGIGQAKALAQKLESVDFDVCFSSPKKRAKQTCEIICNKPIIFDDRLLEIGCGEFDGKEETPENSKLFFAAMKNGSRGVEKFDDFKARVCDFCDMVIKNYRNKNVLIVTHTANVRVIDYCFQGKPKDYDFGKSASVNGGLLTFDN